MNYGNRVRETTTTTGTGNITLAGAMQGFVSCNSAIGVSEQFEYTIEEYGFVSGILQVVQWEVGEGHLSNPTTLVRDTVLASSNGGATVNFGSGTKEVFNAPTSEAAERWDAKDTVAITALRNGVAPDGDDLNKLYNLIQALNAIVGGTAPDGDSIVDTVAELLTVFSTYPEGVDIATALNGKVNVSDIVNTLTETASGKVLDARQGKTLKDLIDALMTTVGGKQDTLVSGTNIKTINGASVLGSGDLVVSGAQPDIPQTKIQPTTDQTIAAGYSAVIMGRFNLDVALTLNGDMAII